MNLQKLSIGQTQIQTSGNTKKTEVQEERKEKPQLKEVISTKASRALKSAALGLMMAAGVTAGAITMRPIQAKAAEPEVTVSQEINELNEVENSETNDILSIHYNYGVRTNGDMRDDSRQYQDVKIYPDGILEFSSSETSYHYNFWEDEWDKSVNTFIRGQFDLQASGEQEGSTKIMNIKTGVKLEEVSYQRGDYIIANMDGTMTVYDKDDNVIGTMTATVNKNFYLTEEEKAKQAEDDKKIAMGILIGGTVIGGGGTAIAKVIEEKKNY